MSSPCGNGRRVGSTPAHGRVFMAMDSVPNTRPQVTDTMTARLAGPEPWDHDAGQYVRATCGEKRPTHWGKKKSLVSGEHCADVYASFVAEVGQRQTKASKAGDLTSIGAGSIVLDQSPPPKQALPGSFSPVDPFLPNMNEVPIAPGESLQSTRAERTGLKIMTETDACRKKPRSTVEVRVLPGALAWCGRTRKNVPSLARCWNGSLPHQAPMPR